VKGMQGDHIIEELGKGLGGNGLLRSEIPRRQLEFG